MANAMTGTCFAAPVIINCQVLLQGFVNHSESQFAFNVSLSTCLLFFDQLSWPIISSSITMLTILLPKSLKSFHPAPQAGLSRATTGQVAACLFRSHLIYNPIISSSIQIILNSHLHSLQDSPIKLFPGKCRSAPAFQALSTLCLVRNARHKHIALLISLIYGFIWNKNYPYP